MAQEEIITKATIELVGGASHTDRRGQVFRGKPFTTSDRATIEHYWAMRPRFTVTALATAPVKKVEPSEHTREATLKPDLFERLIGKADPKPAEPAQKDSKPSKPVPLPWSVKSNLADLLAACRSRDILASDKDTRNKLLGMLQDHDNTGAKAEVKDEVKEEPKAELKTEEPAQGGEG